jgi:hypothetical protein
MKITPDLKEEIAKAKRAKASHNFDNMFRCIKCGFVLTTKTDPVLSCDEVYYIKDVLE